MQINFYCDESCYLQNDGNDFMVLGTIYCEKQYISKIKKDLNDIKEKYGFSKNFEIKWTKVSKLTFEMYKEVLKYVHECEYLNIRTIVAKNKKKIEKNNEIYDVWYYKMFYILLNKPIEKFWENNIINHKFNYYNKFSIYLDKKNSNSNLRSAKLMNILQNTYYNFIKFQHFICDSKDFVLIQVIDLIIGAIAYKNRKLDNSISKVFLVNYIESLFSVSFQFSSSYNNTKFNNFIWTGRGE